MKTLSIIMLACCFGCASTVHPTEDQVMNAQLKQMQKDADDLAARIKSDKSIKMPTEKKEEHKAPENTTPYYELLDDPDLL